MSQEMRDQVLIGIAILCIFTLVICLMQSIAIRRIRMTTAEVLAALEASNELTAEIGNDLDALIALVGNTPGVPAEVADAVNALKGRLVDAAAKFTA